MNSKFHTKAGRLTPYALACGYIEQCESPSAVRLTLWHEGGPCYHVRAHDHANHKRLFWDSFESLSAARKRYDVARREIAAE